MLAGGVEGPFFPDWEFHALFGLDRDQVRGVLSAWPAAPLEVPDGYESAAAVQRVAVNNAMNHLLGYPHGVRGEAVAEAVGASEAEVAAALRRWRGDDTIDPSGKGYFDRLA